jgi:hypothetical protein
MNSLSTHATWPEALATVLSCHYEFGAGRALAFGVPSDKHFRISYNYFADGELHDGELMSAKAIPQGTLFPVRYNPEAPHDHVEHESGAHSASSSSRRATITVGIIGSVILSLAWFAMLRGCH